MTTLDILNRWLNIPAENEHLEFKEAKHQFDKIKLLEYCVAFANEGGGYIVLGVNNTLPRQVVGTRAFNNLGEIKSYVLSKLHFRIDIHELLHPNGRVLIFEIPKRPTGQPQHLNGTYLMRSGEELVPMTSDQLRRIFSEGELGWLNQSAKSGVSAEEVIALLDTQAYFDLVKLPYPTTRDGVLTRLNSEKLITAENGNWIISNLAALLLAKNLETFSLNISRKAPRLIIYKDKDKMQTKHEQFNLQGYAVGFDNLIDFIYASGPQNNYVEEVIREEVKMFPKQALRELIANALVHQDFSATGSSVMIEMYADRIEISNPGTPPISIERFIDEYRSRNELLADIMRRFGICEEKGSGIDKVIKSTETNQLPAPDFRVGELRTTVVLFAHQNFSEMSKNDRLRACYQHCCLMYVSNKRMSNQTLRERFQLPESATASIGNCKRCWVDQVR